MQFTFNPTLSVSVSGDLTIDNLTPGNYSDSNIITITASTNNNTGYTLYADVGNSTDTNPSHNNTNLTHTNGTNTFASLSANKSSLSNFDANSNTWGYSYSVDNGTTWISGDYNNYNTGYNGLPIYSSTNGIKLADTDTNTSSTLKFKIGARSTNTQAAGEYTNTINFYGVTHVAPDVIMQDLDESWCTTTPTLAQDSRDGTLYHIQRLADGNCWMLDNLAIDLTNPTVQANLTESTTNASNTTLGYLKGTTTRDPSTDPDGKYATAGVSSNWTSGSSYSAPFINMNNKDIVPTSYNETEDFMKEQVLAGNWKIGGYYNYCAASAGSYCYGNNASQGASSGNATEDICPAGWRMPTGNTDGEYQLLANKISGSTDNLTGENYTTYRTILHLSRSGLFNNGSADLYGSDGYWWSSTRGNNGGMYGLDVYASRTYPSVNHARNLGLTMRCVLDKTMQNATASSLATAMPNVGDSTTLVDERDGQRYTVAKLADGKYWMTENLNLAGGTALSANDTNVSSEYIANFTTSGNLTKSGNTIILPASGTDFGDDSTTYVNNSENTTCGNNSPCYSYYSWMAATLGGKDASGNAITGDGYNAAYSICPKGWKLPAATAESISRDSGGYTGGDFYNMAIQYGMTANNYFQNTSSFYNGAGTGTAPNLPLTGYYLSGSFYNGGSNGRYWSATSSSSNNAYNLDFAYGHVYSAGSGSRRSGFAVRCLFAG